MKFPGWLYLASLAASLLATSTTGAAPRIVHVLPVTGPIGPATGDFVRRGLERAQQESVELMVLRIDTPGGLDDSMRDIIRAILASKVPVAAFVAPGGARAASAGTYILYASPIAAMAPGTNLGAATPVAIGGAPFPPSPDPMKPAAPGQAPKDKDTAPLPAPEKGREPAMTKKQVNDAAAYIRSLAALHGRNADWAELSVRESVSLSAVEAKQQDVIDLVATDVPDLLAKLHGRKVKTAIGERVLSTEGATTVLVEPDWRTRFLAVITHPSIALILMMLGFYGLIFEFMNPGMVLPGVIGGIALLLGLFALQLLPVSYAGLGLVLLGLSFMIAEVFVPSYGALGLGGVLAFVVGGLMLVDTDVPGFGIPVSLIVVLATTSAILIFAVGAAALKARRRPVVTGREQLIGSTGTMLDDSGIECWARVHGERWQVRTSEPLKRGQAVRVTGREGLVLIVVPATTGEAQ